MCMLCCDLHTLRNQVHMRNVTLMPQSTLLGLLKVAASTSSSNSSSATGHGGGAGTGGGGGNPSAGFPVPTLVNHMPGMP
jgi:uncharacterized membrane protein YgcG